MPKTSLLFAILFLFGCSDAQAQLHRELFASYELYRERSIETRRFKHSDLTRLIERLEPPLSYQVAGQSMEGRDIYLVKAGNGPVKILLWSQMHGDEPTATMALMDIFNFLGRQDGLASMRGRLLQSLTIYFIPMLNPDGAERFQRRNALGIDINRDAARLITPEGQILKKVRDEMQAAWGFNLHDQSRYTTAGRTDQTATVSFLAPPYNEGKEVNAVRGNAMRLIGLMNKALQAYIPGKVARYYDDFEPRAFGDNIQKWGTSTILIESGGLEDDLEKQYIRKLNYVTILSALDAIANREYQQAPIEDYNRIPFNHSGRLHDLIIREVQIPYNDNWYPVDIAIRRQEVDFNNNRNFYYRSSIEDIGDLSTFTSYEELNAANNYRVYYGRKYPNVLSDLNELKGLDVVGLLKNGYTQVEVRTLPEPAEIDQLPIKITAPGETIDDDIAIGRNPSLLLVGRDGRARYVLVNGFVFDLDQDQDRIATLIRFL